MDLPGLHDSMCTGLPTLVTVLWLQRLSSLVPCLRFRFQRICFPRPRPPLPRSLGLSI
jgi:hypothetical protein